MITGQVAWTGLSNLFFKKVVKLVYSHYIPVFSTIARLAFCDGFHAIPDLPHVVLLQLLFHLLSV